MTNVTKKLMGEAVPAPTPTPVVRQRMRCKDFIDSLPESELVEKNEVVADPADGAQPALKLRQGAKAGTSASPVSGKTTPGQVGPPPGDVKAGK